MCGPASFLRSVLDALRSPALFLCVPVVGAVVTWAGTAQGQRIERLIMPGPVIRGHADLEDKCSNCHRPFERTRQEDLCLDCHKDVAADIKAKRGFHGRRAAGGTLTCKSCHTEHIGRNADIVHLDPQTFDHNQTDFPLRGAHRTVTCASCHKPAKKHRNAPSRCVDCHKSDSPHRSRLGDDCAACHNERKWSETRFDHSRRTRYPLTGKHAAVACRSCHANERYKRTPTTCYACHRFGDVHAGTMGTKCDQCHTTRGWKSAKFDHDRQTKFPLTGAHRTVQCVSCHKEPPAKRKPKTACIACHRKDDAHSGRNGTNCASCHVTSEWAKSKFDHDRQTKFPLRGKHAGLTCASCHKGQMGREKLATSCVSCHRADDVHKGSLGSDCRSCHNESGWAGRIRFDHDLTRFPLIGQHAVVPCEECHTSQKFVGTSTDCASCHERDDAHEGRLGPNCATCHNPNGWALWRFDHNRQTDYVLDGKHENLKCEACHVTRHVSVARASRVCGDCHRRDDPHRRQFGLNCGRCHTTSSFENASLRR